MKYAQVIQSAVGATAWVPVDPSQNAFGVGFNIDLDSAASGITYTIQHTFDDVGHKVNATISRSGTTVTVTVPEGHGLNTGDSAVILNANQVTGASGLDGTYDVTVSSTTVFTYTSGTSGTVGTFTGIEIVPLRVQPHSSIVGAATSTDGNYAFPIRAMRLNMTARTAGSATLTVWQGRK